MASLVESEKYGSINTTDTTTNLFYVIMFPSESHTLQDNTKIYGQIITAGKLAVKAQYLCSIQVDTNWYWNIPNSMLSQCQHSLTHFMNYNRLFLIE